MKTAVISIITILLVVGAWVGFEKMKASKDRKLASAPSGTGEVTLPSDTGASAPEPKPTPKPAPKPEPKPEPVKPMVPEKPEPAVPEKTEPEPMSEIDKLLAERYPMPDFIPLLEIVKGWSIVPERAFPKEVALTQNVAFELLGPNGQAIGSSNVAPGTLVKPLAFQEPQLQIASLSNPNMKKVIPVEHTDFKQRIEGTYNQLVTNYKATVLAKREKARAALLADPDAMASLKKPKTWDDTGDPRFASVKASLASGQFEDVRIDEAKTYRWNGTEKIGGEFNGTFETVTVNFEVRTIFGVFPTEYKALIRDNQVVAWVDPITLERAK